MSPVLQFQRVINVLLSPRHNILPNPFIPTLVGCLDVDWYEGLTYRGPLRSDDYCRDVGRDTPSATGLPDDECRWCRRNLRRGHRGTLYPETWQTYGCGSQLLGDTYSVDVSRPDEDPTSHLKSGHGQALLDIWKDRQVTRLDLDVIPHWGRNSTPERRFK